MAANLQVANLQVANLQVTNPQVANLQVANLQEWWVSGWPRPAANHRCHRSDCASRDKMRLQIAKRGGTTTPIRHRGPQNLTGLGSLLPRGPGNRLVRPLPRHRGKWLPNGLSQEPQERPFTRGGYCYSTRSLVKQPLAKPMSPASRFDGSHDPADYSSDR